MKLNSIIFSISLLAASAEIHSQEMDLDSLQESISIFSSIVEESLALDQATGIFGNRLGGVDSIYLYGQGALLEIRTPLANQKNQMGFSSLGRAMRSINRANPFAAISAQSTNTGLTASADGSATQEGLMEKMASVDFSLVVNSSIQQAAAAARSLRNTGSVDDAGYAQLQQELDSLRVQTSEKMTEMRALLASSAEQAASAEQDTTNERSTAASVSSFDFKAEYEAFMVRVEPLKERALEKAADLQARSEQAQKEYAVRLEQEIEVFEIKLFATLCTYGATLRELPNTESVSIILKDLGEETERSKQSDKVHVVTKENLLKCQSGEIDAVSLLAKSTTYSY
ncbi:MAG: hypothetical protein ACJAY7_000097 [Pseudohongiellaceae bacterium]|jgi:hypothetical protein